MNVRNILLLIVLLALLLTGFLSGRIAGHIYPDDAQKKARADLIVKGLCVFAVLILYIICFA